MLDIANSGKIEIGAIYRMNLDENDEVTPKDGMNYRPKFLIIVGNADYGYYVAYVLVNKSVNQKIWYYLSFANLVKIREIEQECLLKKTSYQGKLTEEENQLKMEKLETRYCSNACCLSVSNF